jgi:hypothetical protein
MAGLLDLVPGPIKANATLAGAIAAAAAMASLALWHHHQITELTAAAESRGAARVQKVFDAYVTKNQQQVLEQAGKRQAAQAGIEQDRTEIDHEAQRIAARDRAQLVAGTRAADAADQRLQQRLDAARAAAAGGGAVPGDPGTVGQCQVGFDPQTRLLGAARRALRQLARDADAELVDVDERLGRCVAEYEAVRQRVNGLAAP